MAGGYQVPERLQNFRVYDSTNNALMGIASVELPEIEAMSETVSGAGISGEIETPIVGHYGSMTCTLSWTSITKAAMKLASPDTHEIDLRGSQQVRDTTTGKVKVSAVRVTLQVVPKTVTLGTFEVNATTETEHEFEVLYIKLYVDDKPQLEIDKFNFVARFGGEDLLKETRKALGM